MMEAMKNWWGGLSTRERWLVGVAGLLAVAVLGWALGRPAVAAFLDLESRHRAAIEREGRVAARIIGQLESASILDTLVADALAETP